MPIPHLKRRTYGYLEDKPHGEEEVKETNQWENQMEQSRTSRKKKQKRTDLLRLVGLPFVVLWSIFSFLWKAWKKRPRLLSAHTRRSLRLRLTRFIIIFGVLFLILGTISVAWMSKDLPDPDHLTDRQVAESTKIFDRTGEHLLYEIFAKEKRTIVELNEIPKSLIDGVIATEDTEFYKHRGVRPLSMARALVVGIFTKKRIGATSTLTQQLVKNVILTNERTFTRKIKEIILSLRLEQKYSKEQILKIFFNAIPYGSTNYGVEAASQSYFDKRVSELTLAESAALAGMPKAPTLYLNNREMFKERRNFVLRRMQEEGYITEDQKKEAQEAPLEIKERYDNILAPHFVLYVREQLVNMFGEHIVNTGGLKVFTTLDWNLQELTEKVLEEKGKEVLNAAGADNTAILALDPKSGEIRSMVGSRDFFDETIDGQFNVAVQGRRQPGSSIKPIIYAAAFEKGFTPDTVLFDVSTNFAVSGKPYQPGNYDLKERGPVTMRQALAGSLNIPAVQTMYLVGEKKGIEFSERLGYTTFRSEDLGLTLVLGGGGVSMLEHVNAYATFANNGIYNEPSSILKIEDSDGDVVFERKIKPKQVMDPSLAALMSNILSDDAARAYIFGAGGTLTLPGRPVAVKTGTTNRFIDAWTVGYTPSLAVGVWSGNTNGHTPMKQGFGGSMVAAKIWRAVMEEAHKDKPVESFPAPPTNTAEKPVLRGSTGGTITLMVDKITGKIATSSTPEKFVQERTYVQAHSILHYARKDDPQGPEPEKPEEDPQYMIWESAIQDWIKRKKESEPEWTILFEDPPTEYDDAHSLELIPTLEVLFPLPSSTISTSEIITKINVSAPRGVAKVLYQLDGIYIDVVETPPFDLGYSAKTLESGKHTLTITVEDDVGNRVEERIPFFLAGGSADARFLWSEETYMLSSDAFPVSFFLTPVKLEDIQSLKITAKKQNGDETLSLQTFSDFSNLFNNQVVFTWEAPPLPGTWILSAEVGLKDNETKVGDTMVVEMK